MLSRRLLSRRLLSRRLLLAAAAAGLAASACCADPAALPPEVAVDVAIDDQAGLDIVAVHPVDELPALAPEGSPPELGYQLVAGSEVIAAGTVRDPRVLRSETGSDVRVGFGTATLRLPARAGDLVLVDGAVKLGRAAFDPADLRSRIGEAAGEASPAAPEGVGTSRSPLIRDGDVRGPPARILGTLQRARAVDILILAEGYSATQFGRFRRDALQIGKSFRSIMSRQRKWGGRFNIWVQNVRSRSLGIDDPDIARFADTAFDVGFGSGDSHRCTWFRTAAGEQAARSLGREAGADVTVVLANTSGHGGCASGGLFVVTRNGDAPWVVAHELGHSLLGLVDEYESGECRLQAGPNVAYSTVRAQIPWGRSIAAATPLPTPETEANARA